MFDSEDETYWLVSPNDYEVWKKKQTSTEDPHPQPVTPTEAGEPKPKFGYPESTVETIKEITISGTANAVAFNQLFSSFIMPLKENDVKIEFRIKAKSKADYPITKNSQQYKIVKESASQMGFDLDED